MPPISLLVDCRDSEWLLERDWLLDLHSQDSNFSVHLFSRIRSEFLDPQKSIALCPAVNVENGLIFFLKKNKNIIDWACWIKQLNADLTLGFSDPRLQYRCSKSNLQHELLLKAIKGRGSLQGLRVVDATAGLMRESAILASAGCKVLAIERIALLAELLKHSASSIEMGMTQNLDVVCGNSLQVLSEWQSTADRKLSAAHWQEPPDIIYLDPMYQQGLKPSAALKKEMVFLKTLNQNLGLRPDEGEQLALFESARNLATKKVVVKRAPKAEPIGGLKPASVVLGKALRFDIYPT